MVDSTYAPVFDSSGSIDGAIAMLDQQVWLFEHMLLMPKYQTWLQRTVSYQRASGTTSTSLPRLLPGLNQEFYHQITSWGSIL